MATPPDKLQEVVNRVLEDKEFARRLHEDLAGTLQQEGYELTDEEQRALHKAMAPSGGFGNPDRPTLPNAP